MKGPHRLYATALAPPYILVTQAEAATGWCGISHANHLSRRGWPAGSHPMVPTLVAVPGKSKQRFVLLPPPLDRADPLSVVDLGKAAEVRVFQFPLSSQPSFTASGVAQSRVVFCATQADAL